MWASAATGTPPCGGTLTGGSLTSAQYTASYSYDTLGRLTSAPLGSYTYGDVNHQDAATSVGSAYTARYDAAGDMTCRAPSGSVTCAGGTPTGSLMTYDNERRLATWQNAPSNPTSTAAYWYDGEGQRVAQTLNGVTTYYVGSDEEITGSTLLKYYHIPGLPVLGTITGVTRTYLASDGLGSETVDLSYNGSVLATALYGPYGVGRYATGTMPTSKGYTGQRQDSGSGLDYYGARYYDGAIGQFTSADTAQGPNRYAYVGGNPETATDPSGHMNIERDDEEGGRPAEGGDPGNGGEPGTEVPGLRNLYNQWRTFLGQPDGSDVSVVIHLGGGQQVNVWLANTGSLYVMYRYPHEGTNVDMALNETNSPQTGLWLQVLENHLGDDPNVNTRRPATAQTRARFLSTLFGGTVDNARGNGYLVDIHRPGQEGFQVRVMEAGGARRANGPYMRVMVGTGPDDTGAYLNLGGTAEVNDFIGNDFTHFYLGGPESGDLLLQAAIAETAIDGYEEDNYGQTFP